MDINFLAVLLSGVANMVIGFVWYGPLFSKAWMKEVGLSEKEIGSGPGMGYLYTFIAALVSAAVTSLLVNRLGTTAVLDGAFLGLLLGVGYVATTFASNYVFAQKSVRLYLIDTGYQVLAIVAAAVIATLLG
jgi:uncharacterized membrane protein